jgi:hypothetical protein
MSECETRVEDVDINGEKYYAVQGFIGEDWTTLNQNGKELVFRIKRMAEHHMDRNKFFL